MEQGPRRTAIALRDAFGNTAIVRRTGARYRIDILPITRSAAEVTGSRGFVKYLLRCGAKITGRVA